MSRAEILKHRSDIVELSANLLHKKYSPTGEVFAKMKSGLPWFSLHGFFYRGRGIRSLEGPSAESRHLSNPFLLISPEFWGLSRWVPGGIKWDETKLNQREFNKPDFPYYPIPNQMTWYPDKSSAQVTFLLSNFIDKLNLYAQEVLSKENISFGLTAYNARDFGFKYLAIDTKRSKNLKSADNAENPVEITDRITNLPRFCSYDSRCNHLDIPMLDADQIVIGPLPAHVYIKLWYNLPKDKDDPPNMYFMFNFK